MYWLWILTLLLLASTTTRSDTLCHPIVKSGIRCNVTETYTSFTGSVIWKRDGVNAIPATVDGSGSACTNPNPVPGYNVYCFNDGKTYTLEIHNPENDKGYTFNTGSGGSVLVVLPEDLNTTITSISGDFLLNDTTPLVLQFTVICTTIVPVFTCKYSTQELITNSSLSSSVECATIYSTTITITADDIKTMTTTGIYNINVTCEAIFGGILPYKDTKIITYIASGSSTRVTSSSDSTIVSSTIIMTKSSSSDTTTPNVSSSSSGTTTPTVSSSSSDTTTPTVPSPPEKRDPDIVLIIIICVVVVVAIFVICIIFCIQRRRIKRKKHKKNCQNSETREVMSNCTDNNRRHMSSHRSIATPDTGQANNYRNSSWYNNNKNTAL